VFSLPVHEQLDGDEVGDGQAVGGRVEAAVADPARGRQVLLQLISRRGLMQQSPPAELL